jgi:ABC-type uncharacterized transport system involved in gliding motility auxiliary subunit
VPDDASVVVVAGPRIDFLAPEVDALRTYLGKAGKLLVEFDGPDKVDAVPLTNLTALAHEWGVDVGNNIVVDASGMGRLFGAGAEVPIAATYPSHPITQRFNFATAFPLARSVEPVMGGVNGHTAQAVVQTSAQSWAESDIKGLLTDHKVAFDEGKDRKGPITLAAARVGPPRQRLHRRLRPHRGDLNRRNPKPAWCSSATPTSPPIPRWGCRATATCS